MRSESVYWKRNQPLAESYIHAFREVQHLYEYNVRDDADWRARAEWLDASEGMGVQGRATGQAGVKGQAVGRASVHEQTLGRADRGAVADVLEAYNRANGAGDEALANIARLRERGTLTVVGGQQAGLFTGPMLVIYKAVTIIQTARRAATELGSPVVPVFWIAGEDHDWDEVNHTFVRDSASQIHKLKIEHPTGARTAVSRLHIDSDAWAAALHELSVHLPDTAFKPVVLGQLRAYAEASATLSQFFARAMAGLFKAYGLVLLDSDDPNLRALESPMFARLIGANAALADALQAAKDRIEAAGFAPAAEVVPENANLFVFRDGERVLLQRDGADFTDKRGAFRLSEAELLAAAERDPSTLSNNVMTRPLMQDYVLPVLATVLGPGEIAYWSLTKDAFRRFGMRMPLIVPRREYTLAESTLAKHQTKFGLSTEDVLFRLEEAKQAWLSRQDTLQLSERFEEAKAQFRALYAPILELVGSIDGGTAALSLTNQQKILDQMDFLENRAQGAYHAQFDAQLRQWERLAQSFLPMDKPQERVYLVYDFINRYGEAWLHDLLLEEEEQTYGLHNIWYL
ncbi:hypothetical protein SY83_14990 [Paenibacillus swuensis]|uniref:Putative cysteine ligase BshC n=2 Tax=Paenibacillus swuensis TaxID=1178515 RepID=A0A172TJX1_9BACL|nr:hypothetical protein SY83_14990 [Paenibacillus swuensis]